MEKQSGIAYYDLDTLCSEAVHRNFKGDGNTVGSVISAASYALTWNTFTSWCDGQIEVQRAVNLPNFGTIGFQPLMNNKRIAYIKLNDNFLHMFGLHYNPQMEEYESQAQIQLDPMIKPNFSMMSKSTNMEKSAFHQTLLGIFQLIGELLSEHQNVEIDLGAYGKFQGIGRQVIYAPLNKMKTGGNNKQTVKTLMDYGTGSQNPRGGQLPPLNHGHPAASQALNSQVYQVQTNIGYASNGKGQSGVSAMIFKSGGQVSTHNAEIQDSPTRRFNKPYNEAKITSELLGAGDDPMASQQEFSLLANNPKALMSQSFKRPLKANSRFPPVIDPFSRTLAAPVSSQRHYLSVSHKIGTNYTPTGKGFYIDIETRVVRYKDVNETGTKLDIVKEGEVEPADEAEEYDSVMNPQNADPRRINARRVSFNRYRQYVENEISVDVIAPIRQYWLTHIIELIPGDLHAVEKERIEHLIDTMLNEINKDYFDSVRKSILDYILKDQNEMRRLGIQQVLNQPITWGDDFYKGIEPNEEWKHNVMMARMLMSENLCICSQATLELMRIWREKDYYQMYLVQCPSIQEKPVSLQTFKNQQTNQIDKVRNLLNTDWSKAAVDILREELENLDKDQTKTFFDSVAALMSNQVRELTTKSIDNYVDFFRRFQKKNGRYPTPEEIISREYDPDTDFENTFLTLKLQVNGNEIGFQDQLPQVRDELVKIVSTMVEKINNIPRADNQISNADKTHLWYISSADEIILKAELIIKNIVDENLQATAKCINVYDEFLFLLQEDQRIENFLNKKPYKKEEFVAEIERFKSTIAKIRKVAPFEIRMSMFLVECSDLNENLVVICKNMITKILKKTEEFVYIETAQKVANEVRQMHTQFAVKADTSNELVTYEKYLEDSKNQQRTNIVNSYLDLVEWLVLLHKQPYIELVDDNIKIIHQAYQQTNKIQPSIEQQEVNLKIQRDEIEKRLMLETKAFQDELNEVKANVDKFKENNVRKREDEYNKMIDKINKTLAQLSERMVKINQQEQDLEITPSEYPQIDLCKKQIKPFQDLWELCRDWTSSKNTWETAVLKTLNPDEVEKEHKRMRTAIVRLVQVFEVAKQSKPLTVAKTLETEINNFKKNLPVIRALCAEGLKERHTAQIVAKLDSGELTGEENLNKFLLFKADEHKDTLEEIADTATKEYGNEKILNQMFVDWEPLEFTPSAQKDTYKLGGDSIELIQQTLDDHLIKTQTMKGSPFAKYFLESIIKWEDQLQRTQDNVEMWLKVQAVWMYLEPVFSSEDIMKQMPVEGNKFREVDKDWRALMKQVKEDPRAYSVIKIPNLHETVFHAYAKLEEVQKGLNQYLESKRGLFPRFFFLSDPELLEILSETKDPLKVQPFLKKCFEAIESLEFDDETKIHAMKSSEGERIQYVKIIDPVLAKGNVEEWLKPVEEVMIKSVKDVIDKANLDYTKAGQEREKWVTQWPGQAVLAVSMMKWTSQAEEAMKKSGIAGLEVFYEKQNKQLNGIVGVVRTNITRLQRATLEALVVLDVHARDVIKTDLLDANITSPTEFAWLAQLRYYWEENDLWVKITNSTLAYNYEYLGNSARLVITPLTDRCYRTLCGALYLNYGGAPEGPAGTGKTETVKDLSKALARQCIVFNCSDDMKYDQMGKMFKGLASCGAWSCFDEFNRINLEVLSVIAQQLQSIQIAIEKKLHIFRFEGVEIPIKWTCNCFITMNPGYAGRAELPDNLKALFRTVAMMVPDYGLIAEISLYSFGFINGKALAQKIVTTYKLCSEQLSSQEHYDYGMRAVKSVLTAAGNLKRKYIEQNESELMLRAIKDVNLAKFLAHDLPLFKNITSDLFPGVVLPEPDYEAMLACIQKQLKMKNLQGVPYFMEKIIQLYEMITVRHGLMVVGDPFAGKTSAIMVLAGALCELKELNLMEEMKTNVQYLNPKSITMGQLYGFTDPVSKDWTDGILAVWFRVLATGMGTSERRWLVFDGPVDAIWIENMNTVLDDNKKLCLNSGEIIQMSNNMSMIFEPADLAVASPATVSRCGMVYMQPLEMGWRPLIYSWKNNLPTFFLRDEKNKETYLPAIDELIDVVIPPLLAFIQDQSLCKITSPSNDQNILMALLRLWRSLLKVFDVDQNGQTPFPDGKEKKENIQIVDSCFLWACVWSICCVVDTAYRKPVDIYLKKICNGEIDGLQKFQGRKILPGCMDRGTIYDYVYFPKTNEWKSWIDLSNKDEIDKFPKDSQVQDIIVTTIDKIRYSYIQEYCIQQFIPTLFVGPTGTGKSVYIQNVLLNQLPRENYMTIEIGFSAQTHCNQVQDIVDNKLDKIRTGIFGPRLGMKCVIFIDDLNMPKKEEYGAQPPIEILRQFMAQGGWYDYKDKKHPFRIMQDTLLICAMGPPGGGKSFITPRFQRHFNVVAVASFDENSMKTIFSSILKWYFRTGNFPSDVAGLETKVVAATLQIYKQIQEELKPTPLKSHYTFNLRDVSKVICGICLCTKKEVTNTDILTRLWAHEITRVFGDRLINDEDRTWVMNAVKDAVRAPFGANFDALFKHLDNDKNGKVETLDEYRGLAFGDIYTTFGMQDRPYEEILDPKRLQQCADEALVQYNNQSDKPMDLVLFSFAIEHLLRIGRILKQPGGHALLVGVGGSGRQSLTRLASRIMDNDTFQIEIKKVYRMIEFREDIKALLRSCGGKGTSTSFIFTDNSIKEEAFLEDINNILNTGEVPNIFPPEEKAEVQDSVRSAAKNENRCLEGTPQQLFSYFVERCKKALHIVMCFSPIGDSFRNRVRNFPSLVNCTTIDWFSEWPKDALQSVAVRFLGEIEMTDSVRQACVTMVQTFHTQTEHAARKFKTQLKRHYYVTPTSYLELISTFKILLANKRQEIKDLKDRYANGYDCLIKTEGSVSIMQGELEAKKPLLIQTSKEVEIQAATVEKETAIAEAVAQNVGKDEAVAAKAAAEANAIKMDCQEKLDNAIPLKLQAEEALKSITKNDITEIRTVLKPPPDVVMVMSAVCVLLNREPDKKMDNATGKKVVDYWGPCQKLMNGGEFLSLLLNYPSEDVNDKHIKGLQPFTSSPNFTKDHLQKINKVAANLAGWVLAMQNLYEVNLIVRPKQAELAIAMEAYAQVAGVLKVKQAELKEVMDKVAKLRATLQQCMDDKARLEADVADCEAKLIRATKLISGLGGQKSLWLSMSEKLSVVYVNLTGDVLISSGMIAYLGAFNSVFRDELSSQWVKACQDKQIPNSGSFSLSSVLGDAVQIRNWTIQGLPSDSFSIENAIITTKTNRWPLYIDPQGQANKWIRNMGKESGVKILKFTEEKYLKFLESSIRMGNPVLIENVGEELDPAIEPLLQKQIVKKGNTATLKIGDTIIEYNKNFKFYLTTKLRNPHYLPEVSTKVTILNFMITYEGLTDQLLGIVVAKENPDLEIKKEQLVLDSAKFKQKLQETENQILTVLKESKDILGDASAIEILSAASVLTIEIEKKQEIAKVTEEEIDESRIGYKPIALRTAGLFFCIQDMCLIDPMYQYSLPFFALLFTQAIAEAPMSEDLDERSNNLNKEFLSSLYRNICRSLFEKDKMIFSFLLCVKLNQMSGEVDMNEFRFLLTGGVSLGEAIPEIPAPWLSENSWAELCRACKLNGFKGYMDHFLKNINTYKELAEHQNPHEWEFPPAAKLICNKLRQLIVLRCIRPDKLVPAISNYVVSYLGNEFIQPPPFELPLIYKDSSSTTPLIFVLSPGSDPMNALSKFGDLKKKQIEPVSLGQGQGEKAENAIREAQKSGNWVVLQNCHLAVSWMGTLERICEELSPDPKICHRDFRLWLTSYPSVNFPVAVLQNGVKMTNEAPKGLRANVSNSFLVDPISNKEFFNGTTQPKKFRKLLFGLCFFHAVIQERRLYGPLGWNIRYEFNETDLRISVKQLAIFLDEYPDKTPFEALKYLTGECNYGGRVTEGLDRRTLMVLLEDYYNESLLDDGYKFSPSGIYYAPKHGEYDSYIEYAKSLPQFPEPEIFGFHANAAITKNLNETETTLSAILLTQSSSGDGGDTDQEATINAIADNILKEVPKAYDVKAAEKKYPVKYEQSMNTVLTQELTRFNALINTIRSSLVDIKRAIKGEVLLSPQLEGALSQILDGKVPALWLKKCYPSLKPLGGFIKDLKDRLQFFQKWIDTTIPEYFWINLFYFTHGFLTGALQNYARKNQIAIDTMDMDFDMVHDVIDIEKVPAPAEGIHVYGMWLEGCKWDPINRALGESDPKVLYSRCIMMWFKPIIKSQKNFKDIYECPLYKTTERRGVLATTGHSSNFCLRVHVPSNLPQSHWIKRGVALVCSLND